MTEDKFWELMDAARNEAAGDAARQADILVEKLTRMPLEEIFSYEHHFVRYSFDAYDERLWAAGSILDDLGDDDFLDFRDWLISRGKAVYCRCLSDPESLADIVELGERVTAEEIGSVADRAYTAKTGLDDFSALFRPPPHPPIKHASLVWKTPEGYADIERLRALFPKLWARFCGRFDAH